MTSWDPRSKSLRSGRWHRLQIAYEQMIILYKLGQILLFTVIIMCFITAQIIIMVLEFLRGGPDGDKE